MNTLNMLINCAEKKLFQIETELFLLQKQLSIISKIPGISDIESNCLMLEYNINFVKRKYLLNYLQSIKEKFKEKCSLNDTVVIHISSIDEGIVSSFLFEVSGHQNALSDMTDSTLFNNDGKPESILLAVKRYFPYDMILPFIQNARFMTKLLKIVFDDSISDYNKILKEVLSLFSFNKNNMFIFYVVSEVLVSYFKPDIPINELVRINNFAFFEKCRFFMAKDIDILREKIFQNVNFENILKQGDDLKFSVRSFSKAINWPLPFDTTSIESNEQQIFQYITYELQKISVQSSYSMICLIFLRISDYLTMTISAINKSTRTGADETFHMLIFIICSARISNFLSTLDFVDKNCPSFMVESKIGYLIEQMKSSTDFINSVENKKESKVLIISPFLFQGGATKILLEETNLKIVLYPNETIPAVFKFSEKPITDASDDCKVIGYLQEFDIELFMQFKDIRLVNTMQGLIPLHFGNNNYQEIDDNDYEKYIASMI